MSNVRIGQLARVAVVLVWTGCGAAVPDPVSLVPQGKPFLWEVTGPGTMHILGSYWRECPEDMPPAAIAELRAAPTFVRLTKSAGENWLADREVIVGQLLLPEPRSLLDWLTWDELTEVEYKFAEYRINSTPGANVRYVRPGVLLQELLYIRACRIAGDLLLDAANQTGKKIVWVEAREQLADLIDDDVDGRELKTVVSDRDHAQREYVRMRSAYRAGDEAAFVGATEPLRGHEAEHRVAWTLRLAAEAKAGPIFVELPVAQLVGPTGVLAGLAKLGYTVTRP